MFDGRFQLGFINSLIKNEAVTTAKILSAES
jgi:hypothetical protein